MAPIEKMKKIVNALVIILLLDVEELIKSYKVMYFFHDLCSVLKALRMWLRNKHFTLFLEKLKKQIRKLYYKRGPTVLYF